MDWEDFMQAGVLIAVGFLVIRKANFKVNKNYLLISLLFLVALWGFFTFIGYS